MKKKAILIVFAIVFVLALLLVPLILNKTFFKNSYTYGVKTDYSLYVPRFSYLIKEEDGKAIFLSLLPENVLETKINNYLKKLDNDKDEKNETIYRTDGFIITNYKVTSHLLYRKVELDYLHTYN